MKQHNLEYLVIPTGWEESRVERAKEEIDKAYANNVIITGHVDQQYQRESQRWSHRQRVYRAVREHGVPRDTIKILDGIDSEEDILYLGQFVQPGDAIHFDTFFLHYLEYRTLVNKAKRDGKFPEGVNLRLAPIPQGKKEIVYGILGWFEEVFKRRPLDYKSTRQQAFLDRLKPKLKWIKKIVAT